MLDLSNLPQDQQWQKAAAYAGVSPSVLQGIYQTESGGGRAMLSPKGAQGGFGIMPDTQSTWEQRTGRTLNPNDFADGLTLAALQLKENMTATNGNVPDALRMYNAGPNRSRWNNDETRQYAGKVLGTGDVYDGLSASAVAAHAQLTPEEAWGMSAADILNGLRSGSLGKGVEHLPDFESKVQAATIMQAAANAAVQNQDAQTAAQTVSGQIKGNTAALTDQYLNQPVQVGSQPDQSSFEQGVKLGKQNEARQAADDAITFGEKLGAAVDANSITSALLHYYSDTQNFAGFSNYDPGFNDYYMKHIDEIEGGKSLNQIEALRETRNRTDLMRVQNQLDTEDADNQLVARGSGPVAQVGYGLAAGVIDAPGWLVGAGVGKAAEMVGVGSRAAFASGKVGTGLRNAAIEGGVGNLLMTATLDAAGHHETTADYAHAAGMGMAYGVGFSLFGIKNAKARAVAADEMNSTAESFRQSAAAENHQTYSAAQAEAGGNATAEQVADAADSVMDRQGQQAVDDLYSHPPEEQRLKTPGSEAQPQTEQAVEHEASEVQQAATGPEATYELPRDLGGASPRYNYGKDKSFSLDFENDVDKAAFIIAQSRKSKRDADYLNFVMQATGMDEDGARAYGAAVRSAIKDQAKNSTGESLHVESLFRPEEKPTPIRTSQGPTPRLDTPEDVQTRAFSKNAEFDLEDKASTVEKPAHMKASTWVREVTAHDPETGDEIGRLIYTNEGGNVSVRVNPEWQRKGVATAMLKLAKRQGGELGDDATGEFPSGLVSSRTDEGQAFRSGANESGVRFEDEMPKRTVYSRQEEPEASVEGEVGGPEPTPRVEPEDRVRRAVLGDTTDSERLFPRPDINSADQTSAPLLNTEQKLNDVIGRYHLDATISDEATRKIAAELIARSEQVVSLNPVDQTRLQTVLKKVDWEAASTTMLLDDNPVAKAFAILALENPEGAAGRRTTASIVKYMRERRYLGNSLRDYDNAYKLYRNQKGSNGYKDFFDSTQRRNFNREVYAYRDRLWMGRPDLGVDPSVKMASEVLDRAYQQMGDDQRFVGTVGSTRIPRDSTGYSPRRMDVGMVAALEGPTLRAYLQALSSEFQKTANFDEPFANEFAVKYLERARDQAKGAYDVPANIHDPEATEMMEDALRALNMSNEQIAQVMGKFSRGGASFTKGRIDMDLTKEYPDGKGGSIRLMDLMRQDNDELLKGYARRTSGDVALARSGVMGIAGAKTIRKTMQAMHVSPKTLRAYDQVIAEFYGMPFGTNNSKWADNARSLTSAMINGGMGFTQMGAYGDAISGIGVARVFNAMGAAGRLLGEVRRIAKGEDVANPWIRTLADYGGEFGPEGYQLKGMLDVDSGFEVYGKEPLTVLDRAMRYSASANQIISGHRAIMAVQIRGVAEQIVQKALQYIRDGVEDKALADMGITPEIAAAVKDSLGRSTRFGPNGVKGFDVHAIEDTRAAHGFVQAVYRGAHQLVQGNFTGETGKWAHDGFLKFLTQFRTFGLVAMQKQWGRNSYVHGTPKAFGYLLGAMSIAMPVQMMRVVLNSIGQPDQEDYLNKNLSPMRLGRATLNYIGAVGILPDVFDITSAAFGYQPTGGRAGNEDLLGGQIAPAIGTLNKAYSGITGVLSLPANMYRGTANVPRVAHTAVQMLPGANLPFLHNAVNLLDRGQQ